MMAPNGMPLMCYLCGNPATTYINTSLGMAAGVPSDMRPVCGDHDPFKFNDMVMIRRPTWEAQQAELEQLRAVNRTLREVIAMTDPCIHEMMIESRHAEGSTMTLEEYMTSRGLGSND